MIDAYQSGKSKREVGEMFGYGRGGTEKVLKRNGIVPRTISQSRKGRPFSEEHCKKISETHHDVSGKNNPMFSKPPGHGKRIYIEHLNKYVRSTWEASIAIILQSLNIPHEYETQRIILDENTTYMPDFWLPDHNLHIEVKGWFNERFKKIMTKLAQRPDINLLVIDSTLYATIIDNPDMLNDLVQPHN